jgi:hypothetical protein
MTLRHGVGIGARHRRVASAAHFQDRFLRCGYGRRQRLAVVSVSGSGRAWAGSRVAPVGVRNRTEERTLLECGGKPSSRTRPDAPAAFQAARPAGWRRAASWGFPQLRKFLSWPAATGGGSGVRSHRSAIGEAPAPCGLVADVPPQHPDQEYRAHQNKRVYSDMRVGHCRAILFTPRCHANLPRIGLVPPHGPAPLQEKARRRAGLGLVSFFT